MDARRWQRIDELFARAVELPVHEQAAFLVEACGSDGELRREVAALLTSSIDAGRALRGIVASEVRRVVGPEVATGAARARATLPPRLADRFVIRGQLGAGGMGVVYEAYDEQRRELVALKAIAPRDPHRVYRLKREFRALADLVHPRLVRLHELFTDGDHWFFTMARIDGVAFLDHVRRDGAVDARALRAVLLDVVDGVCAIHGAGRLHRDLKPSNVLVAGGRAVLLDFGLVAPAAEPDEVAGTPGYMAPELVGGAASTASDWYAVGVMLYEALAGARPDAPLAGPPDLVDLATRLLARDPAARPDAAAIRATLGGAGQAVAPPTPAEVFVGRAPELAALDLAYQSDRAELVRIEGASGIGKSALVDRFLAGCREAVVLRGRCYEREHVPFRALDEVVDALAGRLATMAPSPRMPAHVADLCRIFPVLDRVCAPRGPVTADPQEARRRAVAALAELFAAAAAGGRLVIAIDDLQWSGTDNALLIRELLASGPAALWIASYRSGEASEPLALLAGAEIASRTLRLGPLEEAAACELVRAVWPAAGARAPTLAEEAGGNPFFIRELARSGRTAGAPATTLAALVRDRLAELSEPVRRLVEVVALAGAPIALTSALAAAGLANDAPVPDLRARSLVRTSELADRTVVEIYHAKIGEVVVAALAEPRRRAHHHALAFVLEHAGAPAAVLARHFRAYGELARARAYTIAAAHAAAAALAFDRAAELYGEAIELAGCARDRELERARADALANAGRGPEAAAAYLRAADGAGPDAYVELARRAAHQYLTTGHLERGRAIGWDVFARLGMWIPRRPFAAQLVALARFSALVARGIGPPRGRLVDDPNAVRRYDVTNELLQDLSSHTAMHALYFTASASLRGVRLVDPGRRAEAIGTAAAFLCLVRGRADRWSERWLREQRALAEQVGTPAALGAAATYDGVCATYVGAWRRASDHFADAERWFGRSDGIQRQFQLATLQAFDSWVLFYRGELVELGRRARRRLADARTKNNVMAANAQATSVSVAAWLAADDVDGARRELAAAARRLPAVDYGIQHTWLLLARSLVAIYAGDAVAGYARMAAEVPAIRRSQLLGVKVARMQYLTTRAALALAAADQLGPTRRADGLRREAGALARQLARLPVGGCGALAALVRATLAAGSRRELAAARRGLVAAGMHAHAAAAGWYEGGAARRDAEAYFAREQVVRPERFVQILAPGFGARA